jgi:hypothetical protein
VDTELFKVKLSAKAREIFPPLVLRVVPEGREKLPRGVSFPARISAPPGEILAGKLTPPGVLMVIAPPPFPEEPKVIASLMLMVFPAVRLIAPPLSLVELESISLALISPVALSAIAPPLPLSEDESRVPPIVSILPLLLVILILPLP